MLLAELRRSASIEKAHESKKMFAVKNLIGEETLHKLLCFIIKCFQDSLKITSPANEMSASEIFEAADMLMGTGDGEYGYESVFDVIMAFKHFKTHPFDLYNAFNDVRLRQVMTNYLDHKAGWLERHNSQGKREAAQREPLTVDQVRADYERSVNGQPMIEQIAKQQEQQRLDEYRRRRAAYMVSQTVFNSQGQPLTDSE